jgi:hypothetical protein
VKGRSEVEGGPETGEGLTAPTEHAVESPMRELVPPDLSAEPLSGEWLAPDRLALDTPARPSDSRADEEARKLAEERYGSLARDGRREMQAFVDRANRVTDRMTEVFGSRTAEVIQGHDRDQVELDRTADRALGELDSAAAAAETSLEVDSQHARSAVEIAGRRAHALIAADDLTAAERIGATVSGLVSGHQKAFDDVIRSVDSALGTALGALESWSNARAVNHPTDGDPINAAQNEARQLQIPLWVKRESKLIKDRAGDQTTEWRKARDTTVCGLRCSYRNALETQRQRINAQGRASVNSTLKAARRTLAQQTRAGRRTLHDLRTSYRQEIRTRVGAAKSGLNSQARIALGAVRAEAQRAIGGVQSSARSAVPTYWRTVAGMAETLRRTALHRKQDLRSTAERAPAQTLADIQRVGAQQDEKLESNLSRLEAALAEMADGHDQQSREQVGQWESTSADRSAQALQNFQQNVGGFQEAFSRVSGTVSEAASAWARTLKVGMASLIAAKQQEADDALDRLLTGKPPPAPAKPAAQAGGTEPPAPAGGEAECGHCETEADKAAPATAAQPPDTAAAQSVAGNPLAGPAAATTSPATEPPRGLTAQAKAQTDHLDARGDPAKLWKERLDETGNQVVKNLDERAVGITGAFEGGFAGTVDEEGVIAKLRALTELKGRALDVRYQRLTRGMRHPLGIRMGTTLDDHLRFYLDEDSDDYAIASAYLRGKAVEAARLELADSVGFFNDQEARIEATLRALSPDQLAELGRDHKGTLEEVGDALGGTDKKVFDALLKGDYAQADAHRLREEIDEARAKNNADAVHSAIEKYTAAPEEGDWRSTQEMSPEERREEVVRALGSIVTADLAKTPGAGDVWAMKAEDRAVAYVNREVPVLVHGPGGYQVEMKALTGANRDLATALLRTGEGSVEARAARLGVEAERKGDDPIVMNVDRALYDERFAPLKKDATAEEQAAYWEHFRAAEADRARVLILASRYAPTDGRPAPTAMPDREEMAKPGFKPNQAQVVAARQMLIGHFRGRFDDDPIGGRLVAGLLTDLRPSKETASLAMQHGMYSHVGTNEAWLFRFTERMTRQEIADMSEQFHTDTGDSLEAELGIFGKGGTFTEMSGDDALRMERAFRGVPQTDRERLENAAFALAQQRRETGSVGKDMAEGTLAERVMINTEHELERLAGGRIELTRRGDLVGSLKNFEGEKFTGADRADFLATTSVAQTVAENYAKRIDAFADLLTTGIAILGAIAAAAITVATGGAALPLIAAAVATGLASMGANYAIKGGRYGWEQAALDLGMTAVQAVTAGVGAHLGAASQLAANAAKAATVARSSLTSLARMFTGNPAVDQVIIGAVTGSLGGVANVAFDERTWERSGGDAASALFSGLLKGALSGGATAKVTGSIEALGRHGAAIRQRALAFAQRGGLARGVVGQTGRVVGGLGRGISAGVSASTGGGPLAASSAMVRRGLTKAAISGVGGMAGRGTELAYDAATGKYRGDAGDALIEIGKAGGHSFVQGFGEGAAEAVAQGVHNRRLASAAAAINRARVEQNLPPLAGDATEEGSPLRTAAEDLLFLNQFGRAGGDKLGKAINLDHVVTHGGLGVPTATVRPPAIVEDAMRTELMRHVPQELHRDYADVPIRVLPEAEYRALTRSESGPVATLIEDGRPVVVVREGTPINRLADEGPHLLQTRDAETRAKAARLDEATLGRWDSLDLDTQLDLYKTKIELEIDAHLRIQASLEAELARLRAGGASEADLAGVTADLARNRATLRNLLARHDEVGRISPEQRAAIEAGQQKRPQYLEQPARLFTKEGEPGQVPSDEPPTPSTEAPGGHPEGSHGGRLFDLTPEEITLFLYRLARGRGFDIEMAQRFAQEGLQAHHEVRLEVPEPAGRRGRGRRRARGHPRVDTLVSGEVIAEHKYTQLAEIGDEAAIDRINELADIYHQGARIAGVPSTRAVRAEGETLQGQPFLVVPEQRAPVPRAVLEHAERAGVIIRDDDGRIYSLAHPDGDDGVQRASARDPEALAGPMRDELLRHVPSDQHDELAGVEIAVLPVRDYLALTGSERGPVVTLVIGDQLLVVIREGTPITRLSDEGPHLSQAIEAPTRAAVARHDEATLAHWDELDLDTQIDLYRNKIALEIDAHERIVRSIASNPPESDAAQLRALADLDRAQVTLHNLRSRQRELDALGPAERAAMQAGAPRPDYLDQPARLFSKDPPRKAPPKDLTPEERDALTKQRIERRLTESKKRQEIKKRKAAKEKEHEPEHTAEQKAALAKRTDAVAKEIAERRDAVDRGEISTQEDMKNRLAAVAKELQLDLFQLGWAIWHFRERLGGGGRRLDSKDSVDSMRNRSRDKKKRTKDRQPPRYGDLEGLVLEMIVEQNQAAVALMREHLTETAPHAVLGVERGGAFMAEVLGTGLKGSPDVVAVPKHPAKIRDRPDLTERTRGLDREIRSRIQRPGEERQTKFTIVDVYMGGVFAGELQTMIVQLLKDYPDIEIEVMWMRETHGFERVVFHQKRGVRAYQPRKRDLREGVTFAGGVKVVEEPPAKSKGPGIASVLPIKGPPRFVRFHQRSAAVILPKVKGTEALPSGVVTEFPVDVVLGDDMKRVLDRSPTLPIQIFDKDGNIVQTIPVGTPDPDTGRPLANAREILVRLMQGVEFPKPPESEGEQ